MPMQYEHAAIPADAVPKASSPVFQHLLDTYASEANKTVSVWRAFAAEDLPFRPHPRSSTVEEVMKHQILSERRFFGEFLGLPEPQPNALLPATARPEAYADRMAELVQPRLTALAGRDAEWWLTIVPFFDVQRERIWIFWRRVLHTAHHRAELLLYLRLLNRTVPAVYGPTADVKWTGADPTNTTEAAGRR